MAGLKGSGRFQAWTPQHASCRCCSPLITLAAVREEQLTAMGMADVSACLADLRERHASRFRVEAPPRRRVSQARTGVREGYKPAEAWGTSIGSGGSRDPYPAAIQERYIGYRQNQHLPSIGVSVNSAQASFSLDVALDVAR